MRGGAILGIIVVLLLLVGGFFLFSGGEKNTLQEQASENNKPAGVIEIKDTSDEQDTVNVKDASGPTTHEVDIIMFKVPTLTVNVGDTITWTNKDSAAHTATANDNSFDSDRLETRDTWSFTFTESGSFAYFCKIHPSMKGTITVV
jgi:plastocyanin